MGQPKEGNNEQEARRRGDAEEGKTWKMGQETFHFFLLFPPRHLVDFLPAFTHPSPVKRPAQNAQELV